MRINVVEDPAVDRHIPDNLLYMRLRSILPESYEGEVRALYVHTSNGRLDPAYVKRVISDRYQLLEQTGKKQT